MRLEVATVDLHKHCVLSEFVEVCLRGQYIVDACELIQCKDFRKLLSTFKRHAFDAEFVHARSSRRTTIIDIKRRFVLVVVRLENEEVLIGHRRCQNNTISRASDDHALVALGATNDVVSGRYHRSSEEHDKCLVVVFGL